MKINLNEIAFLLTFSLIMAVSPVCSADEWKKAVVPGINYRHIKKMTDAGSLHIHILEVDINNPKVSVRPELAKGIIGNLEPTSSIAIRTNSVAAINGSFFETRKRLHLPIGLMIIDGQVVSKSILERSAIGITKDKSVIFGVPKTKGYVINLENKKSIPIWGVNRPRKNNEVIIYTNEYGERTGTNYFGKEMLVDLEGRMTGISSGDSIIPPDGFVVSMHGWSRDLFKKSKIGDRIGLVYDLTQQWKNVKEAITGGPLLVKDGEVAHKESLVSERFVGEMLQPTSRTAAGVTKNNVLLLVVVDKQYPYSIGVTYDELAQIMKDAGAENAIGLDGGHTSTMYIDGRIVNHPLNRYEASVSNAMVVTYDGWQLSSTPKPYKYVYVYVYKAPSEALISLLKTETQLSPTTYIPRPEDFGMYGLQDIYNRVIKPIVPEPIIRQLFSGS